MNSILVYDEAGVAYHVGTPMVTRFDGVQICRRDPGDLLWEPGHALVLAPEPMRLSSAARIAIRTQSPEKLEQADGSQLWPLRALYDDEDELRGWLGWLPADLTAPIFPCPPEERLKRAAMLAECFDRLAQGPALLPDPRCFYLAGDRICYAGTDLELSAVQADPGFTAYLAPELIALGRPVNLMDLRGSLLDHMLNVMLFRLLTGFFPFSGPDLQGQILAGESVFYDDSTEIYAACAGALSDLDPEITELFTLAFDYCGQASYTEGRPTAGDWLRVLRRDC